MTQETDNEARAAESPEDVDAQPIADDQEPVEDAQRIVLLESQVEELREKWARAQADYQNLRRRGQSEHEQGLRRTLQPLLDELLLVDDYLELALAAPTTSEESRTLAQGVEMTRTKLIGALANAEVHPIETDGAFDPSRHEAVGTAPAEDVEPGTIVQTVRRGFTWREIVLRPARVIVAADEDDGEPDEGQEG